MVSLNETWLRQETIKLVNIPGFSYVGNIRHGRSGGGVGLLISDEVKFRKIDIIPTTDTLESITVEVKLPSKMIIVVSMYRPPNKPLDNSITDFAKVLKILKSDKRLKILCMDHNLDLLKSDKHRTTQKFLELMLDTGLLATINKPTRITHHSATPH